MLINLVALVSLVNGIVILLVTRNTIKGKTNLNQYRNVNQISLYVLGAVFLCVVLLLDDLAQTQIGIKVALILGFVLSSIARAEAFKILEKIKKDNPN